MNPLHQVAFGWADIRFEHLDTRRTQALPQLHQLPVLPAVQPQHRALVEVFEGQWPQLDAGLVGQQHPRMRLMRLRNERHRDLWRQA